MRELRVGIIGFGMIGKVHAFGYRTFPFYTRGLKIKPRITMVATSRRESAAAAAELLGCQGVTDWRAVTENPEIDAVHICTPNRLHAEPLLSAIEHQKYIYCDKPLVSSSGELESVRAALAQTDAQGNPRYTKTNMMTFHLRFIPALIKAKQLIGEGKIGRVFQYRAAYQHSSAADGGVPFKWKNDIGGGAIRDLGSHLADLVSWLIAMPDEVFTETQTAHPFRIDPASGKAREVMAEDAFVMLTRTALPAGGGLCRGVIAGTKLATGCEDEMSLEIYGEKGALRFSLMDAHYLGYYDAAAACGWTRLATGARYAEPHTDFPSPKSAAGWTRAHAACLAQFLACVEKDVPAEPSLKQGIRVQEFLAAAEESACSGRWTKCRSAL